MPRFHPDQIKKARRSVVTHDAAIPQHAQRVSRVIQWKILTGDRPQHDPASCEILPFRRRLRAWPSPATPFGGDAA